ncbi:hypothetical protein EYF80_041268 [Liparis tanakae]|uniref:Uncharacterized protein n=1 Tax=Liparis tanakae TaxID=230148 RepID=A0A4Z2G6V0_9TELE|nr:hypothetical protein EYF80_041268 [Liparis tanakae]
MTGKLAIVKAFSCGASRTACGLFVCSASRLNPGGQRTEDRGQEDRGQEDRGQRTEDRGQGTEDRRTEDRRT